MNSHDPVTSLLVVYSDLSADERQLVDQHLRECPACAARLDAYQAMDHTLARLRQQHLRQARTQLDRQAMAARILLRENEDRIGQWLGSILPPILRTPSLSGALLVMSVVLLIVVLARGGLSELPDGIGIVLGEPSGQVLGATAKPATRPSLSVTATQESDVVVTPRIRAETDYFAFLRPMPNSAVTELEELCVVWNTAAGPVQGPLELFLNENLIQGARIMGASQEPPDQGDKVILEGCWPAPSLPIGRHSATIHYNLKGTPHIYEWHFTMLASPSTPAVLSTAAPVTHTVQSGESIFEIARQYNVTVEALIRANEPFNPAAMRVGDILVIPPGPTPTPWFHVMADEAVEVYSGPSRGYRVIGTLETNEWVAVTGQNEIATWWRIDFNGQDGWVNRNQVTARYRDADAETAATPVPSKDASSEHTDITPTIRAPLGTSAVVLGTPTPSTTAIVTYTVRPGDSLFEIALEYDISIATLMAENGLSAPDFLYAGQVLRIPVQEDVDPSALAVLPCPDPRSVITAPSPGDVIGGVVPIRGSALHNRFNYYKLEIAQGADAGTSFRYFDGAASPVEEGSLGELNSTALPDGVYTLQLMVIDQMGNYIPPCRVTVQIRNQPTPAERPVPTVSTAPAPTPTSLPSQATSGADPERR